ncbi:MAG TPA: metalloregulator ArsR/SmtB family transcription factor [Actinomycetota bacterium]|nr:metalloregulator ArsR/SmtB family transcription factor [Actinomycetota bacterium]
MDDVALRAVASPRRREILRLVWSRELTSGDIARHFDVTWPAISQNLRVLEGAGLVRARREGTTRYYRADRARLGPLKAVLTRMWEGELDRLAHLAEEEERKGAR